MWDRIKTVKFDTPAGELRISCGFQGDSKRAVSWYESPHTVSETLSREVLREYERKARVLVGADPDPYLEACAAGADPMEVCGPGRAKQWLRDHNRTNDPPIVTMNDYDTTRYGTNWICEMYSQGKFDHVEMERLIEVALAAGDKKEPYPYLPNSEARRLHWQWGKPSFSVCAIATFFWIWIGLVAMMIAWPNPRQVDVSLWAWAAYTCPLYAWVSFVLFRGFRWLRRNPPIRRGAHQGPLGRPL